MFENKQFDGPYEVSEFQINKMFRGLLYFPPESFKKPYPLIIYFHGFPQIFPLIELIKRYKNMLDIGYAFIVFNFRGYSFSEGKISISSQVLDGQKIIEFVNAMAKNKIFDINNINIIAHDFGAYIALILCSKVRVVNKLLLVSPILDVNKHICHEDFRKMLYYINRFLPGNVKGIEDANSFINDTKEELSNEEFQIENFIKHLNVKKLKVIIGDKDKLTPLREVDSILNEKSSVTPKIAIIERLDHECLDDVEIEKLNEEVLKFFKIN